MDLGYNAVGKAGGKAMIDVLRVNQTMTTLLMGGNVLGADLLSSAEQHLREARKTKKMVPPTTPLHPVVSGQKHSFSCAPISSQI